MNSQSTSRPLLAAALLPAVLLGVLMLGPGVSGAPPKPRPRPSPSPSGALVSAPAGPLTFAEVDRLVAEQKYEAAAALVGRIREKAQAAKDEPAWTRALVREVQLRTALHGYETSVRFLREQPWPPGPLAQATLDLFYGQSLVNYLSAYSWEIRQREKVESKEAVDLKKWTAEEIRAEAAKAYGRVFARRAELGSEPASRLGDFVQKGNYPERVRGTLRDTVTYLFADLLADTSHWSPEENELYRLDLAHLLGPLGAERDEAQAHPLVRLAAVLDDLEAWHVAGGRKEAALEARLARLRHLHASFTDPDDRKVIRADLERWLAAVRDLEWWAVGQAQLAQFVKEEDAPDALVRARQMAQACLTAFPTSIGGQQCRALIAEIDSPEYALMSMTLDGPRRRSVQVEHRNLPRLHFRAYAVDLQARLRTSKDYNLLPGWQEIPGLVQSGMPVAQWTTELPATPDFRSHRTFVSPPLDKPGLYVVVASARADFLRGGTQSNQLQAVNLLVSDLVLVHRMTGDAIDVTAVSGRTGAPQAGVAVALWRLNWNTGHQLLETRTTGADGSVRLVPPDHNTGYALVGRHGRDESLAGQVYWNVMPPDAVRHSSLVYTDRSVYRPQQQLLWKVVAYEGGGDESRFRTSPGAPLTVTLQDANGQEVEQKVVATNSFGSVSGEFTIPAGRLLGQWSVRSSLGNAAASVRVEEYKRPTFEVSLLDPEKEVRLNQRAALRGEARYYFGLPVTTGKVAWRVTRQAVVPWWWWWSPQVDTRSRVVASGDAQLGPEGRFDVAFTPEADSRASRDVTWTYALSADVTDEGGETRSASRSFRLGFVSVEARVSDAPGFLLAGQAGSLTVRRTDLDGTPRAGAATWTLLSLVQPERTLLPAEQPLPEAPDGKPQATRTPGDAQRPRWETQYSAEQVLRQWKDGSSVARGALTHDAKGEAVVMLPGLEAGPYRLRYETKDAAGSPYVMTQEIVIAQPQGTPLAVPGILSVERASVPVGGTARILVHSGVEGQPMTLELWRAGRRLDVRQLVAGRDSQIVSLPIALKDRGGFGITLTLVRDHQVVRDTAAVFVPWDDRALRVSFSTFRDLMRPGSRETWRVAVHSSDPGKEPAAAAEVLAYMYDRSLDLFAPHTPASALGVYPNRTGVGAIAVNLNAASAQWSDGSLSHYESAPSLQADRLDFWSGYGIGGPGRRTRMMMKDGIAVGGVAAELSLDSPAAPPAPRPVAQAAMLNAAPEPKKATVDAFTAPSESAPPADVPLRSQFSETAFWQPQLLTGADGQATFEFTVPDSVTSWTVWAHAITQDLRAGSEKAQSRSVKDLMVRPYLPRFLREGDAAEIKLVVNNASDHALSGDITFEILDAATQESLLHEFGVDGGRKLTFTAAASGSASVTVPIVAPRRLGPVIVKVTARAGDLADGEQRALPVLPSRLHLVESRFATLKGAGSRTLDFPALARGDDPSRATEQLVVTLDAQLFYGVLDALPYLVNYPYECTEQTLNRFVSTGIVSSLFAQYPAIGRLAAEMAKRDTRLEVWDKDDPNRRMALEETPWVTAAQGGKEQEKDLIKVLDPKVAKATREDALARLRKSQTAIGGFPWWPGGPPSPYMTLYIAHGLANAREFGVDVPKDMTQKAFAYLHRHYLDEWVRESMKCDCGWEFVTFLNFVLTSYPDDTWTGGVFTEAERKQMLDFSFKHWKAHTPYLKGYLALTLHRRGRPQDARLVWDSVMDSAKTDPDTGTSWAPEDRGWLWYNDTTETHAFALRTLGELQPKDPRREGLVQWLFLHKKLNHWDSTRSTAEVLYSLAHYLKQEGQLGVREDATVRIGSQSAQFVFEPDHYTGKHNQVVVPGGRIDSEKVSSVTVEKTTPGMMFASATWHYATDRLPTDEAGDLFGVQRRYFRRENKGGTWTLAPLAEGTPVSVGDEVEVQLSLRARQAAEYVHLRDPRGAGFEPVTLVSGYKWDTGLGFYEEVRDSGENFFFEWLPAGEYAFHYRVRATTAGVFRVAPAEVQSMYAPEFAARSASAILKIEGSTPMP